MLQRLILKVTKFQLPPRKRLNTVVKNILGGMWASCPPPPFRIGLNQFQANIRPEIGPLVSP